MNVHVCMYRSFVGHKARKGIPERRRSSVRWVVEQEMAYMCNRKQRELTGEWKESIEGREGNDWEQCVMTPVYEDAMTKPITL